MKRIILILLALVTSFVALNAQNQNVGINTNTPDPSAVLDIESSSKGILIPRLTTAQRNAIAAPANALMVFDTDAKNLFFYDASNASWTPFSTVASSTLWDTDGNQMWSNNSGNVGIGTEGPAKNLHLKGTGASNPGIAISAQDSLHNVIIEIDETNDGFQFIGSDGLTSKVLLYIDKDGNVGYNTNSPQKNLQIKGNGLINPSIALTNEDSTYSVIIEIDETNDAFQLVGSDGIVSKDLMNVSASGAVGFGTPTPLSNLEVKGDASGNPTFRLSNENADNYVIIEIDETNDGIEFIGNNDGTAYTMMFADNEGKIGIGTTAPEAALHVATPATSDPTIKLTKDGYNYEYSMGIEAATNSFVVKRDTVSGGTERMMEFKDNGELEIKAANEIKFNAPVVISDSVMVNNLTLEDAGVVANLKVEPSGEVLIPGNLRNSTSYLDFPFETTTLSSGANTFLNLSGNGILNVSNVYSTTTNQPTIGIQEDGFYDISYAIGVQKFADVDTEVKVTIYKNGLPESNLEYFFRVDKTGRQTLAINSRLMVLTAGDVISLGINIENYIGASQNITISDTNSYLTFKKVSD